MNLCKVKRDLKDMPIAISAISLGFMGLSTAFVEIEVLWIRHLAFMFSIFSLGLLISKTLLYPHIVLAEIKNPQSGSTYPTMFMIIMLISNYLVNFNHTIGKMLWILSILGHFIFSIFFIKEMIKDFNLEKMIPSWFIPTVAIGLGAITSSPMNMLILSQFVFYYSLVLFIIIVPIMIYRMIKYPIKSETIKPTIMIMASPANICLGGYLTINNSPNEIAVSILSIFAYISVMYTYIVLPSFINSNSPSALAPLTFPLSIGVTSCQKYVNYLGKINSSLEQICKEVLYVQYIIATCVIFYVIFKIINMLLEKLKNSEEIPSEFLN